jgi:hypothetical protein
LKKGGGDDNAAPAAAAPASAGGNYKLFSELEAIYKPGSGGGCAQTGSGSGLTTGDDNAILEEPAMPDLPGAAEDAPRLNNTNNMSETEDVAAVVEQQEQEHQPQRKRKRRKAVEQVRSASASFFERLVQRLMEHQESLHRQFLEAMERRERERAARDEAWRRQEADNFAREAAARAQDRASAAAREAAIIAYLEKLSGEAITLPPPPSQEDDATTKEQEVSLEKTTTTKEEMMQLQLSSSSSSSRWPKHEVEALIRVRTGLEGRFQEPGLKGPLWEEVSARMAAAGYPCRSAKRCKEKWENINKYFRKAKESGKKRPSQAKTCPYFDELDRLYSRSSSSNSHNAAAAAANKAATTSSSELLDAVVKYPDGPPPGFAFQDRDQQQTDGGTNNKEEEEEEEEGGIGRGRDAADGQEEEDQDKMHFV